MKNESFTYASSWYRVFPMREKPIGAPRWCRPRESHGPATLTYSEAKAVITRARELAIAIALGDRSGKTWDEYFYTCEMLYKFPSIAQRRYKGQAYATLDQQRRQAVADLGLTYEDVERLGLRSIIDAQREILVRLNGDLDSSPPEGAHGAFMRAVAEVASRGDEKLAALRKKAARLRKAAEKEAIRRDTVLRESIERLGFMEYRWCDEGRSTREKMDRFTPFEAELAYHIFTDKMAEYEEFAARYRSPFNLEFAVKGMYNLASIYCERTTLPEFFWHLVRAQERAAKTDRS